MTCTVPELGNASGYPSWDGTMLAFVKDMVDASAGQFLCIYSLTS